MSERPTGELPEVSTVAADIRELLAATDDGVDVPAHDGLPGVRLIAPTVEALRSVYKFLDIGEEAELNARGKKTGSLMARAMSLRASVLQATMPGLDGGPHATRLVQRLGNDHPIMREAWNLCMLPVSLLTGETAEADGDDDGEERPEAPFPARPTM